MIKILICLFFILVIKSQEISILIGEDSTKFAKFEKEMISLIIAEYNLINKKSLTLKFLSMSFTEKLKLLSKANENSYLIGLQGISITEERQKLVDFSETYMLNKVMFLKSTDSPYLKKLNDTEALFGAVKGTIYEKLLIEYCQRSNQKYKIYTNSTSLVKAINDAKIDFMLMSHISIWNLNLKVVQELETQEQDQFALVYPKKSKLKNLLASSLNNFLRSKSFKLLINKHFGKLGINYFQLGLKKR
jgi:ABC-type amino acid transport substrate-binding protein